MSKKPLTRLLIASTLALAASAGAHAATSGYVNPAIAGEWEFTLNGHYLGSYSLKVFTESFTATISGSKVVFESSGSPYNIVGEFTAENTLTFTQRLVGSSTSVYGLWQSPFVNTDDTSNLEALTEEPFTAIYDPAARTLTFPPASGLRYGYFSNQTGAFSYWDDAFDFMNAVQKSSNPPKPAEGIYTWSVLPTDIFGSKEAEAEEIDVEVKNVSGSNYIVEEVGETTYFHGRSIPFIYDEATETARFEAVYTGDFDNEPIWCSAFVCDDSQENSVIEAQQEFIVGLSPESGFAFSGNSGFAWFLSSSAENFDIYDVYSAFYVGAKSSGIGIAEATPSDSLPVYYDLHGNRVKTPGKGIFIRQTGDKVEKVILNH